MRRSQWRQSWHEANCWRVGRPVFVRSAIILHGSGDLSSKFKRNPAVFVAFKRGLPVPKERLRKRYAFAVFILSEGIFVESRAVGLYLFVLFEGLHYAGCVASKPLFPLMNGKLE